MLVSLTFSPQTEAKRARAKDRVADSNLNWRQFQRQRSMTILP